MLTADGDRIAANPQWDAYAVRLVLRIGTGFCRTVMGNASARPQCRGVDKDIIDVGMVVNGACIIPVPIAHPSGCRTEDARSLPCGEPSGDDKRSVGDGLSIDDGNAAARRIQGNTHLATRDATLLNAAGLPAIRDGRDRADC